VWQAELWLSAGLVLGLSLRHVTARILIVGGYGVVGRYLAERLVGLPVTVAGRSLAKAEKFARTLGHVQARYLDVHYKASLDEALADVQLVVSCAPMDEPTLLRAAIARGCDYLDIGERTAFLEHARALHGDARAAGVTAVIGMGLMPGIVNVMARAAVERLGGTERLETALLLSADDEFGEEALGASPQKSHPIVFPTFGRRCAQPFAWPDQNFYPQTLGVEKAASFLALTPPWVLPVLIQLRRLGLSRHLLTSPLTMSALKLFRLRQSGSGAFAGVVHADRDDRRGTLSLTGTNESRATATAAALVVRALFQKRLVVPGVQLPEEVVLPGPFFQELSQLLSTGGDDGVTFAWST